MNVFENHPTGNGCPYCGGSGGSHSSRCPNADGFFDEEEELYCEDCGKRIRRGQDYAEIPIADAPKYSPSKFYIHARCAENMTAYDFIDRMLQLSIKEFGEE